jgi:hypothetical protein
MLDEKVNTAGAARNRSKALRVLLRWAVENDETANRKLSPSLSRAKRYHCDSKMQIV